MAQRFSKGFFLITLFCVCFLVAALLKKFGPISEASYKPESFELVETPILDRDEVSSLYRMDQERKTLIQRVTKSVVCISTEGIIRQRFTNEGRLSEQFTAVKDVGSGVIVTPQGHIVTNHHVVAGKQRYVVSTQDGNEYDAALIGSDPNLDIAVLKISSDEEVSFSPMSFGDSDEVRIGQTVFAVGNPYGLGESVTQGIISAKERSFSDQQRDLFQSDAAINPGNSGGPLVNVLGEIIGINVAVFSGGKGKTTTLGQDYSNPSTQGLGFSIPSNDVKGTFLQIAEKGRPVYGFLGVTLDDLVPKIKVILNYDGEGVAVGRVTAGSPAQKAGILPNDIIVKYGGQKVKDRSQINRLIQRSPVGEEVEILISRESELLTLKAKILDSAQVNAVAKTSIVDEQYREVVSRISKIGMEVRELKWIEKKRGDIGVMIHSVTQGSLAASMRLKEGDRVLSTNGHVLHSPEEFYQHILDSEGKLSMVLQRNTSRIRVKFTIQ